MHSLRNTGGIMALVFLPLFLFVFGLLFSLYQVYGSASSIESALEESGAYETVVQNSLNSLQFEENGEGRTQSEGIPISDAQVQRIISEAMPPELLQEQTTGFLDAFYSWLRGEQDELRFTVDLQAAKTRLVAGLSDYAAERAEGLPVCTAAPEGEPDPFHADCVPPDYDRDAIAKQIERELEESEFLEDPIITASELTNDDGQPLETQWAGVRRAYDSLLTAAYVTGFAALLLTAGAVLLPLRWRTGLRRTAITYITVGAVSALVAWAATLLVAHMSANLAADNADEIQATLAGVLEHLVADHRGWWVAYGVVLAVAGIASLVALRLTRRSETSGPEADNAEKKHQQKTIQKIQIQGLRSKQQGAFQPKILHSL